MCVVLMLVHISNGITLVVFYFSYLQLSYYIVVLYVTFCTSVTLFWTVFDYFPYVEGLLKIVSLLPRCR